MKKLGKVLFGAALLTAAIASTTPTAYGVSRYCAECVDSGDCMACCFCSGHNYEFCALLCS